MTNFELRELIFQEVHIQEEGIYEDGTYVSYKDDIADRIDQCIGASSSMEEFYDKLPQFGLKLKANKNGSVFHTHRTKGDYVTFELVDQSRTRDGQRFSKDAEVNGELRKAGSLVKCSVRSFNFDKEGYGLNEIAQRIASGETYEPSVKKKKSVGDYMKMISGASDYSFLDDVNKENTKYWTEMAARLYEPDESEGEKPKKCTPVRGYDRTSKRTETGKQDTISEPVIKKQEAPASMAPPEVNPLVADLMARGEKLEAEHKKQRTEEADYSPLRKKPYGI